MSIDDLLVVGFGVFVGYWVVANLLLGARKPAPRREETTQEPEPAAPQEQAWQQSAQPWQPPGQQQEGQHLPPDQMWQPPQSEQAREWLAQERERQEQRQQHEREQQEQRQEEQRQEEQRREGGTPAWHEVLEVAPQASVEEIRRAYQAKLAQCETGGLGWLGEKFRDKTAAQAVKIQAAYRQALREKGLA